MKTADWTARAVSPERTPSPCCRAGCGSSCTAPPPRRRRSSRRWPPGRTSRASASTTCTPPARRRSPRPRPPRGSSRSRSSPARRCARRSRRAAPTSCRSSSPTSPGSSPPDGSRSTSRCCSSRRPTTTATARSARRSTPPRPRPTPPASSSPRSTSRCRARTATACVPLRAHRRLHRTPTGRCSSTPRRAGDAGRGAHRRDHRRRWSRTARRCRWASARIPDAVLRRLHDKHDLGIHTEMFSDGVVDLVEAGAVTNRLKTVHPGRIVTSFVDRHRARCSTSSTTTRSSSSTRATAPTTPRSSARTPRSSRSTRRSQIDLTGQVCADSIGHRIYSGIGGQMDFIRGAALSPRRQADHRAARRPRRGGTVSRIVARAERRAPASSPRAATCTGSSPSTARSTCTA